MYGSVGNDQYAMNDQPLEFGTVIEAAPQPADSAVIAAAPQTHPPAVETIAQAPMSGQETEYYQSASGRVSLIILVLHQYQ